jgi:acyl-CoA synthetase (NDP forming)
VTAVDRPGTSAPPGSSIDLRPLFAPRSIAIVGASPRGFIAQTVRDNLVAMGASTRCHFVNPRYEELLGQPCYPSLEALPEVPDIVVVAVNPLRAATITEDAARLGVPAVIVPGGGVVEGGDAAREMQADVARIAREHSLALLGPNCMGVIDYTTNSATYIGDVNPWLPRGHVAAIAQSGSVTDAFIHSGTRIGFSRIVSCGSEVVLDACDYLAHSLDDPETHAVLLFVEGFKRPERFLALADRARELGKPVAVVKVGRSPQAAVAALAHSGSLAGEDRVTDAALAAAGVIRCADLDELLETAELIAGCDRMGRSVGSGRTGVVTVSTGEASLIADMAPLTGVDLPPVPEAARAAILEALPTMGYIGNPLDPWGAADESVAYRACFEAFADSGAYDVLALVHDFPYRSLKAELDVAETVAAALVEATRDRLALLPVFVSLTSGEPPAELVEAMRTAGGVPVLRGAQEAFRAIAHLATWEARRAARTAAGPPRPVWPTLADDRTSYGHDLDHAGAEQTGGIAAPGQAALPERESLALLRAAGLPVTDAHPAPDAEGAVSAARAIDGPVAIKLDAAGLAHKTEAGAVRLDLRGDEAVRAAAADLLELGASLGLDVRGVLVEPMAAAGVELFCGMRRDPLYGPVVLVGLGGILAEVLDDVAIRLAPLRPVDAEAMLDDLRGAAILRGARGRAPVARRPIAEILVRLGALAVERPDIIEVDLNPVVAGPDGAIAVDALVVVETEGSG